jgi:hypothetical protein
MAKPIIDLPRGIPKTDRDWLGVFEKINKFLKVVGDQLQIGGDIALPPLSVGTGELRADAVTNDKLRDSAALSIVGRAVNTGGNPEDIISTVSDTFVVRRGSALTWDVLEDGDIPATIARDSEVTAAITAHEAAGDPHPGYTTSAELVAATTNLAVRNTAQTITGAWVFQLPPVTPTYTVATLPTAATYARGLIYVSDEAGGAVIAFSDGTNWRRVTDRNIVS